MGLGLDAQIKEVCHAISEGFPVSVGPTISVEKFFPFGCLDVVAGPIERGQGMPRHVGGLVDVVKSPMYATAVGLVIYGMQQQRGLPHFRIREENVYRKVKNRMKEWLGEIF